MASNYSGLSPRPRGHRGIFHRKRRRTLGRSTKVPLTTSVIGWRSFGAGIVRSREVWAFAMPLQRQRINWMASPPLVPDDGPIDIAHLKRMTLGDAGLEREVLAMFAAQAVRLIEALAALPPEAAEIAHTLNGSARAIGAFKVAEAAEALEAALREGEPAEALAALQEAVIQAGSAIGAMLRRS